MVYLWGKYGNLFPQKIAILQKGFNMSQAPIYQNIAQKDHFSLFKGEKVDLKKVADKLDFSIKDVALATGVAISSVRFDHKMPKDVAIRITEWASLLNLVAQHFNGDVEKTALWFKLPNPLLGNLSPRLMIRAGHYNKLLKFITNAVSENKR